KETVSSTSPHQEFTEHLVETTPEFTRANQVPAVATT
ncbi:hypothetical protein DBR06_SOUSAS5810080, partial [Sousa chinensis]